MKNGLITFVAAVSVFATRGEEYQLDWFTIDGGGGTSSGGGFELSGTFGQPDSAISMTDGIRLEGGFWPAFTVPGETPSLKLHIRRFQLGAILSWSGAYPGYMLEATATLPATNWTFVAAPELPLGDQFSVAVPLDQANRYFRLRRHVAD